MVREVNHEVYARALAAAETLREQLEQRLNGMTSPGFRCGCGACSAGPSEVVGISIPTTYQYQIAMKNLWTCQMRDNHGKEWSQGLATFIPRSELYPMFRNHFAGIEVRVDHPSAQFYFDDVDRAAREDRKFTASSRTVVVSDGNVAYVRPIGDLTNSIWVSAEIRVDTNLEGYSTNGPLLTCNVDPFEFGQRHGRGVGQYYRLANLQGQHVFYIPIPVKGQLIDLCLPIARLVAVDRFTGEATFELDNSVELFQPAAN